MRSNERGSIGCVGIVVLILAAVLIIWLLTMPTTGGSKSAETRPSIQVPQAEYDFISAISAFKIEYMKGSNEYQKSTVRRERAQRLSQIVPDLTATDWIGVITEMQTTSEGHGTLSLKLPGNDTIYVKTWNNSLSDIGSETLIPAGSELYAEISQLAVGDSVTFRGQFGIGRMDYVKEVSVTESGSMEDPEFLCTFTSVRLHPPSAPE